MAQEPAERPAPEWYKPGDPPVISLNQRRLWYLYQLSPDNPAYNVPYAMRVNGVLDTAALKRAFDAVVSRHEVLRTVYVARQGLPVALLLPKWSVPVKEVDLRDLPAADRENEAKRLISQEARQPFSLARDVKLRILLVRLAEQEYFLLHTSHHIAFEGGSVGILHRHLRAYYDAFISGRQPELPEPELQYSHFAVWQNHHLRGPRLQELMSYWQQQLSGAQPIHLPSDHPRPAIHNMAGHRHFITFPPDLVYSLNDFSRLNKTTSFRGLLATFNVFLYCYTGTTDISVGSPVSPPSELGLEDVIGFFVNTVVLRTRLSPELTFRDLLGHVDKVVREAVKHSDLPFDRIVEAARPPRDSARTPLFQVNFRAPKEPYPTLQLTGIMAGPTRYIDNYTCKFDLALEIETSRADACYFEYRSDLFERSTIEQMAVDVEALLRSLIAQPDTPLDRATEVKRIMERVTSRSAGPGTRLR